MNKSSLYISLLALVVAASALAISTKKGDLASTSTKGAEIAAALENDPQMIINALQKYEQIQRENQIKEAAKAFQDNIEEINNNPNTPFVGDKDADIVLVEFFDFSCGYCKRLAPAIEQVVASNPDIKVVFKPITFVSPISKYAAQAALAAHKQGKFMPMYKAMLESPARLTEASINETAQRLNLDMTQFAADVADSQTQNTINEVAQLAEKVQVHGVPFLVLNGTPLQAVDAEGIQAEIDKLK